MFAANDVFLLPSLFEGTPLTLIEAMAAGLPVVTTATCGMLDTIRDGENGRLIPDARPQGALRRDARFVVRRPGARPPRSDRPRGRRDAPHLAPGRRPGPGGLSESGEW